MLDDEEERVRDGFFIKKQRRRRRKRVYVVSFVSDPAEGSYTQIVITKDSIENCTCDWQSP